MQCAGGFTSESIFFKSDMLKYYCISCFFMYADTVHTNTNHMIKEKDHEKKIIGAALSALTLLSVGCSAIDYNTTGVTIDSFMDDFALIRDNMETFEDLKNNGTITEGADGISYYSSTAEITSDDGTELGEISVNADLEAKTNEIISMEFEIDAPLVAALNDSEMMAEVMAVELDVVMDCIQVMFGMSSTEMETEQSELLEEISEEGIFSSTVVREYGIYNAEFDISAGGKITVNIEPDTIIAE